MRNFLNRRPSEGWGLCLLAQAMASRKRRDMDASLRWHDSLCLAIGALLLTIATPLHADSSLPPAPLAYSQLPDPKQEAKAKALMESLRCLVCQGQSIADSDAEMAGDMRAMVREKIAAGEKPEDIRAWLVARYGKWVSYDPPLDVMTAPLWIAPLLLLGIGLWIARGRFRKHR